MEYGRWIDMEGNLHYYDSEIGTNVISLTDPSESESRKMTTKEKLRAIEELEEFMVIDDWSLVYMPDLHETLQKIVDNFKEELDKEGE